MRSMDRRANGIGTKTTLRVFFPFGLLPMEMVYWAPIVPSPYRADVSTVRRPTMRKKYPVWLDGREFEFWTNYSDQSGIATLTQVGDKLHWVIIKHPDGECFAPTDAWLSKRQLQDKNQ